jgi:hypothetical protein
MSGNQMSGVSSYTQHKESRRATRRQQFAQQQNALGAGSGIDGYQAIIDIIAAGTMRMSPGLYVTLREMGYEVPASIMPARDEDEDDWREVQDRRNAAMNGTL